MIIQEYVKEKFPLAYDYFESCGWKYCPISYKNLWGWKKQLEKGSLGTVEYHHSNIIRFLAFDCEFNASLVILAFKILN